MKKQHKHTGGESWIPFLGCNTNVQITCLNEKKEFANIWLLVTFFSMPAFLRGMPLWHRRSNLLNHFLDIHYYLLLSLQASRLPLKLGLKVVHKVIRMIFLLQTVEGKHFGTIWQPRDIINVILQIHEYNLDYMSVHLYQCSASGDFLLLAMPHGGEDVIKIHKSISPTVNITFNLTVIKVINYNYNHHFKDRGSEAEKVNGISLKLY